MQGTHKNGCKFSLTASTGPDGSVSVSISGEHNPSCGTHPGARRLHPTVTRYILELLKMGCTVEKIYSQFHEPNCASKREPSTCAGCMCGWGVRNFVVVSWGEGGGPGSVHLLSCTSLS